MQINLNEKIEIHFARLETLANEADLDSEESYSSRAAAMSALSNMLKSLTKSQESVINMERLLKIEQILIETAKKFLTEEQHTEFLDELEKVLGDASNI